MNDIKTEATLNEVSYKELANSIRFLAIDAIEKAGSGHPGMPMGFSDVASVLWRDFLQFDPANPSWINRDRFILSTGHGSMLLYALLHMTGYEKFTLEQIKLFRQYKSITAGHPEFDISAGIETTTGPLGQGLGNAVGIALGQQILASKFSNQSAINHKTYVVVGDGCLMEGLSEEAISLAGHWQLKNLICLFDDNRITIDGATALSTSTDITLRFQANGWNTISINGHGYKEIHNALNTAQNSDKPTLLLCRTIIGYGSPNKSGTSSCHGSPLGKDEVAECRKKLEWKYKPFEIPRHIYNEWKRIANKNSKIRQAWENDLSNEQKNILETFNSQSICNEVKAAFAEVYKDFISSKPNKATRQSSQICINKFAKHQNNLIGGSADLTASNNTKATSQYFFNKKQHSGTYINYGIREHAMGAIMNGLAIYGFLPYAGTFLTFSDYMRPAIRLSAIMELPTIFVFTHDSIGLGEDGPTHQPVEHLSALRSIPRLQVMRPADAVETAECWQIAIESQYNKPSVPSAICLSRQALPAVRNSATNNMSKKGGYVIAEMGKSSTPDIILIGTGSELSLAIEAGKILEKANISSKILSFPCLELWHKQDSDYQQKALNSDPKLIRIIIEAGVSSGWQGIFRTQDYFLGVNDFGLSAPADKIFSHFDLTTNNVVSLAKNIINANRVNS